MAARPSQTSLQSPLGRPACGLVCRPKCGLATWLTEVGPYTAPRSRQSHPGPLRGLWKDQQTAPSGGNFSGSPSPDRQGRDREGRLGKQAAACVQGAAQTPSATGKPVETDGVCAKWGRARRPPTRQRLLDPPGRQREGGQEVGDLPPPCRVTLVGPSPVEPGSSPSGQGAWPAPGGCDRR